MLLGDIQHCQWMVYGRLCGRDEHRHVVYQWELSSKV